MPIYKKVNTRFFKKWTSEMAYILGFFCADGSMIKNKRGAHFIEFGITDRDLLEKIKKAFNSDHRINTRKRDGFISYRLQIGSKEMFNDLLRLGLCQRKFQRLNLPKIPEKYFSHFVRGYFDGDGHVCVSRYLRKDRHNKKTRIIISGFTSCAKDFLHNLHSQLKSFAGIVGGSLFYSKGYRLSFSIKDSLALYKFLYNGDSSNLYLTRKKKIFEKYFNMDP